MFSQEGVCNNFTLFKYLELLLVSVIEFCMDIIILVFQGRKASVLVGCLVLL